MSTTGIGGDIEFEARRVALSQAFFLDGFGVQLWTELGPVSEIQINSLLPQVDFIGSGSEHIFACAPSAVDCLAQGTDTGHSGVRSLLFLGLCRGLGGRSRPMWAVRVISVFADSQTSCREIVESMCYGEK